MLATMKENTALTNDERGALPDHVGNGALPAFFDVRRKGADCEVRT